MNKRTHSMAGNWIWFGLGVGLFYWVLESAMDSFLFQEGDFLERLLVPDMNEVWMRSLLIGLFLIFSAYAQAVTKRRRTEDALRESEARFADILGIAPNAILSIDAAQHIMLFNKSAERIFGYRASEVIGQPLDLLLPPRFLEAHRGHIRAFAAGSEASRFMGERREILGRRKDGTEFPAEASISKLSRNGQNTFTAIVRDITERKRAEEKIQHLAYYDALTGLPNRARLHRLLQQALLAGQHENKPVALLLLDLDRFREINDALGHPYGDLLLQHVGSRLMSVLRPNDTVARLGGDEFALLLPLAETQHATLVARKILEALEEPFEIEGLPVAVEASLGIALYPDHGANTDRLIQRADVAMYVAKESGSGHAIYAPEYDQHLPSQLALMGELRHAIDHNQLFLQYQPKIDLKRRQVVGVEALVRWQHPELGMVPPDQFILPAERTGLIRPLTRWVLKEALRQCHAWRQARLEISMAVNLSVRALHDPHLPDQIAEMLRILDTAPVCLELEITETAIMADPAHMRKALTRLSKMGVRLAVDDFGIGYSSLGYLKKLPVDAIKIDKSFVMDMAVNADDAMIVRSTIDLAHDLGLKAIAEGVENKETWDRLVALGCDMAQGYFICRPLPAAEITRWMRESPWGLSKKGH